MHLAAFMQADANYHMAGWRSEDSYPDASLAFSRWVKFVEILERGKFDMLFVADSAAAYGVDDPESFTQIARNFGFEPFTLVAALSQVTTHLGLAMTASTTWSEPYTIARMFASLDRISGGRAAWNVVTGRNPEDALNYSCEEHVDHDTRYQRAEEFVDVCRGLWDSYDDEAFVMDRESGVFLDPDGYRVLRHRGEHFQVKGPLNVPRPVQGRPVIVQAGQSGPGMDLASRVADCVFTHHPTLERGRLFYSDIKQRAARFGRAPETLKVLPGVTIYVAPTRAEAQAKFDALQALVPMRFAMKSMAALLGDDLSGHDPDGPIPTLRPSAMFADPEQYARKSREEGLNLGQFAMRLASTKSHNAVIGTPEDVADNLQSWFEGGAADGFNLLPPQVPGSLEDFVDLVVPELQRRGIFRREYEGPTLRDLLGLDRPAPSSDWR